jgi:hypothetical protein
MTSNTLQNNLIAKNVLQKNPEYQHWYRMTTQMQKSLAEKSGVTLVFKNNQTGKSPAEKSQESFVQNNTWEHFFWVRRRKHSR